VRRVLFLANRALGLTNSYIQAGVGNRMANDLGAELFDHLQRLSLRFHAGRSVGDLVRRVTTNSGCVRELVLDFFFSVLSSVLSLVLMFAVMWHLDRFLSVLALIAAMPLSLLVKRFTGTITERSYQHQQLTGATIALAEQTLTALPVVQAFGRENLGDTRFRDLSRRTETAYLRTTISQLRFRVAAGTVTAVGTAVILGIGGLHKLQGSLSLGSLLVFLAYLSSLYTILESLAYSSSGFASAAAGARRVFEILNAEEEVRDAPGARPLKTAHRDQRGHVRLDNVIFGYQPERPVLCGVSLEALPGESIAIVGPTGVGKSTLASLIPRFYDPWEGQVLVNGQDVRQVELKSLRNEIALVLQEPFLLPLTVAENISYGRPDASRDAILKAALAANADEFIRRLPQGYNTIIGERGATLSVGERQRLSVARAILKDAPILILDEPTSAVDAGTEVLMLDAIEQLMKERTTIIIAHRLSTIRRVNRIIVFEGGKIVEAGTHKDLMSAGHFYYRLHELQMRPAVAKTAM
jgi:ABC-type multidrug transport system fused ATPase/permease subunit